MKIAFLCLAHTNFEYLGFLSDYCCSDGDDFYVHFDRSCTNLESVEINTKSHVLPEDKRKKSRWGTIDIVTATLELINMAVSKGVYDRFLLISGFDFPLVNKKVLKSKIDNNKEYIEIWGCVTKFQKGNDDFFKRHWYSSKLTNLGEAYVSKSRLRIYVALILLKFIRMIPVGRSFSFDFYCKGSQWWCVTNGMALEFLKYFNTEKVKQFSSMHAPDEKFFHTIAMNSHYKNNISTENRGNNKHGIHYIDWGGGKRR